MCCKLLAAITTIGLMLFGGVDWNAVGKQYRPKALGAESDEQFYRNLIAMLYELGASHLGVIPKEHPE